MEKIIWNRCQTPLEELELEKHPQEVQEQFWDFINNVPFIRWMISKDRPLVSELPRDEQGRAIIDVTKPPILEHTEYFRQTAIEWQSTGKYTNLRPNRNPNSEFGRWLEGEKNRCWNGLTDQSTGMWITGDQYFFLNYDPMQQIKTGDGGMKIRTIDFPNFWDGHFLVYHYLQESRQEGHHAAMLASRGKGKSYMGNGLLAKRFILGESRKVKKKVQCVVTAADKKYIFGANQILNMFQGTIDFCALNTQFAAHRLTDSAQTLSWVMGYKDKSSGVRRGSENAVMGFTSGDDQSKLNGTRGVLYLIEEAGIFKDLLSLYQMIRPSVEDGNDVYGLIYMYGTAGDDMSDFTALQEIMYNPRGYNMKALNNVYDKEGQGRKEFTMFFPAYMNRSGCMDKDGNSDVTRALLEILIDRYTVKYNSTDINAITKRISQYPITPQEAIVRSHGSIFPITELNERLNQIDNNPNEYDDVYVGELTMKEGTVQFVPTVDLPIRNFPTKDNKVKGCIEIFEMPQKGSDGKVPPERYIAGIDPYDSDEANTMSLGSILLLDTWTDKIVAEYTGRPMFADDFYEICRLMCLFYNCKALFEQNLKGIFSYFSKFNSVHLLAATPEYLRDRQLVTTIGYGNKACGVHVTVPIIKFGFRLIRDWLLKPVVRLEKDADGNDVEVTIPNLYNIRNRALLKELILYNPQINVDRCVLGNTQIMTKQGIKEIKDITIGTDVLTLSGEYNKVCQQHRNPYSGLIYKFRALGDYRYLHCTYNHPVLCRHKTGASGKYWLQTKRNMSVPEYKNAEYISKDDYVLVPKRINLPPCLLSDDKLYLLGWYLADGNASSDNYVKFLFQGNQYEIAKKVQSILDKYWGRDCTFIEEYEKDWKGKKIKVSAHNKRGAVRAILSRATQKNNGVPADMWVVKIASKEAKEFFIHYGGSPNHKDLAESVYNSSGLLPLLRGFFEGDGHYRCEVRCDGAVRNSLELNSIYENLIHKIRQILIDEGIWSTVRRVRKRGLMSREQYSINIVNQHVIPIIRGSLKFPQVLPAKKQTVREHYVEDDWGFWVKARDISSYEYCGEVYNIGVENDHTYCANGIVTHNCMALVQLMLYREEKMILFQGQMGEREQTLSAIEKDEYWDKNYPGRPSDRWQ